MDLIQLHSSNNTKMGYLKLKEECLPIINSVLFQMLQCQFTKKLFAVKCCNILINVAGPSPTAQV